MSKTIKVDKKVLKGLFDPRERKYFSKYEFGLVLVIGGGEFYSGAPGLAALAAFKTGADMVRVMAPKRAADIIASFSPNFAAYPLEGKWLIKEHVPTLLAQTESAKMVSQGNVSIVIGGGAGRSEETKEAIREFLSQIDIPAVIDAAAIHALADDVEPIRNKPFLITPRNYEFFLLTKREVKTLPQEERERAVLEEAARLQTTILLKGKPDIVSDGKEIAIIDTGSPYMSVGGTGDVLSGICGTLMAQGVYPFLAGQAGSFIVGKAGELVAAKMKEGLLASDVAEAIPQILHG